MSTIPFYCGTPSGYSLASVTLSQPTWLLGDRHVLQRPLRRRHFRYTLVGTPPYCQNHFTLSRYRPPKINSATYLFFWIISIMAVNANQVFIAVIGKLKLVYH